VRLYLDTSALIKLYVEEDESIFVEDAVQAAETTATSIITYVEARSAFSRRRRDGSLILADYHRVVRELDREWQRYFVIPVTDSLVKSAGSLAETHALRDYDAIHLASADFFQEKIREPVTFGCWDSRLETAARRERLQLLRPRMQ
jgi:predicted nucleic acid-binding protein